MKKTALALACFLALFSAVSCSGSADSDQAEVNTAPVTEAVSETTESSEETEPVTEEAEKAEEITEAEENKAVSEETEKAEENELDLSVLSTFEVTSEDLHDGVWDPDITNTSSGSNRSPQLSWEATDGASDYVVYMIDTTAGNWIHWRSVVEGQTELAAGGVPEKEYVGPYPPEGTHDYEVYVFALKEPAQKVKGALNAGSPHFWELMKNLDNDGGNVLAYGHLTGTYTKGD